jgi:hypothetical protein
MSLVSLPAILPLLYDRQGFVEAMSGCLDLFRQALVIPMTLQGDDKKAVVVILELSRAIA